MLLKFFFLSFFIGKPKISEEYEASALARISSTIDSVFKDEVLPYGHEEIYRVTKAKVILYLLYLLNFDFRAVKLCVNFIWLVQFIELFMRNVSWKPRNQLKN